MKTAFKILLLLVSIPCYGQSYGPSGNSRTIAVQGDATVKVEPDEIVVYFGVETQSMNLSESRNRARDIAQSAIDSIVEAGVPKNKIQTDFIEVSPRYADRQTDRERFLGYFSRYQFVVTIESKKVLEEILTIALNRGVNYIQGIEFRTKDLRKHRDKARSLATKAAKEKATAMAEDLGVTVGDPIMIRENPIRDWYRYHNGWERRASGYQTQNVAQNLGSGEHDPNGISFGMISVLAQVQVTFEILESDPGRDEANK